MCPRPVLMQRRQHSEYEQSMNPQTLLHDRRPEPSSRRHLAALSLLGLIGIAPSGVQAAAIDLVRAAPEGSWLQLNQNAVSSVWTPGPFQNDYTVQGGEMNRIIYAWSSFAWDNSRSNLIIYGGGHANYGSNDVYTFNGTSQLWERSSLPSKIVPALAGAYTYGYPADGSMNAPASAHTYDNTVYLKVSDRYLTFGGAAWNNGGNYMRPADGGGVVMTGPYLFDPSKADPMKVGGTTGSGVDPASFGGQMWQNRDAFANNTAPVKPKSFVDGFSDTTVIGGKDVVYIAGTQDGTPKDLYRYTINSLTDPSLDTWERVGTSNIGFSLGDTAGALDPVRNIFVRTGEAGKPFAFWDIDKAGASNPDQLIVPIDLTGGLMPASTTGYGLVYDPERQQFIFWRGGSDLFALTPPNADEITGSGWTVTKLDVNSPGGPGPLNTIQVLGKWQYASDLDAFVALQGATTGDVWVYKPEGWDDPAALVPEPGTYAMMGLGLWFVLHRWRRSRASEATS